MIVEIIFVLLGIGFLVAVVWINVSSHLNGLRFRQGMKNHMTHNWLRKMGLCETADILSETIMMSKSIPLHILRKDGYLGKKKRLYK